MYWDQCGGLRDRPFVEAVRACVSHDDRFPTVARLKEHYRDALRREAREHKPLPPRESVDRARVIDLVKRLREQLR